jgi:hypothetical protein
MSMNTCQIHFGLGNHDPRCQGAATQKGGYLAEALLLVYGLSRPDLAGVHRPCPKRLVLLVRPRRSFVLSPADPEEAAVLQHLQAAERVEGDDMLDMSFAVARHDKLRAR